MTNAKTLSSAMLVAAALGLSGFVQSAIAADPILNGSIQSASGEKMGGVTVSAKGMGQTITTSVYTDQDGNYYFPPMPVGKYRIWAQALTYETAKNEVDLGATKRQDFKLDPIKDPERMVRQLPGDELLAALPGDTVQDAHLKTMVRKNCTGCHSASFPLQHKFDEAGWSAIIDLMKRINVLGVYQGEKAKPDPALEFHQKELAAYLARARGPGPTSMKFKLNPRPSGEAARAVYREYDVPMDHGPADGKLMHDGSDWSLGTPSNMNGAGGVHDTQLDFDGNIWFTYSHVSHDITIGRIDAKTGAVKFFKLEDQKGYAAGTHGIVRDEKGIMWFNSRSNVQRGQGGLGKIDPKEGKITVYIPQQPMSGTAGTLDADLKGNIWVTSPDGALRFNIEKETFTEFKSVSYKMPDGGPATVYGLASDRDGNGWWLLMSYDLVNYSDIKTGKSAEFKLEPEKAVMDRLTPEQRKLYETFSPNFNSPYPWAHAPRRMGADKNGDYVWVGNSFGGNFAKVNIKTKEVTFVPLPNPEAQQPYQISVDKNHNVWTNLWSTDQIAKFDPSTSNWTIFNLPTRGTESRHISLLESERGLQVSVPYDRTRKVAVMTIRSDADVQALKSQAEAQR